MVLFILIPSDLGIKQCPQNLMSGVWVRRLPKSQIIVYLIRCKSNYNPEGLFHDEQVKTGVTPLLNPSRLCPETRDYNNSPLLSIHTHIHTRTLTRRKKIHIR